MQRLFSVEHVKGTLLIFEGKNFVMLFALFIAFPQKYVLDLDYIATTY